MTDWFLGTMGYGYKDWHGVFYPDSLKSSQYLPYYSKYYNAVEMDSTFYGIPRTTTVKRWAQQTPPNFKFCPKTPRSITHEPGLPEKVGLMRAFTSTMENLGAKLGSFLIQFPPDFTAANIDDLSEFLYGLPTGFSYSVEFRHLSWASEQTAQMLLNQKIGWVSTEYIIMPKELNHTADHLYIRWLGQHGQFERKNRVQKDVVDTLEYWLTLIQGKSSPTIYGFFNNDFSGHAPETCNQFKKLAGLPFREPSLPQQGRLF